MSDRTIHGDRAIVGIVALCGLAIVALLFVGFGLVILLVPLVLGVIVAVGYVVGWWIEKVFDKEDRRGKD